MEIVISRCLLQVILDKKGIAQYQLAEKSGISASNISDYINNRRFMSLNTAMKVALSLNVSIDSLYEYKSKDSIHS